MGSRWQVAQVAVTSWLLLGWGSHVGAQSLPQMTPLETVTVEQFEVVGSTIFSPDELDAVLAPFQDRPLQMSELLQAADAITRLYTESPAAYVTSGAFIPLEQPQPLDQPGSLQIQIQVVEGRLADIEVCGVAAEVSCPPIGRLDPGYVRQRLALAGSAPLSLSQLQSSLELLQLDPLIETISAELSTGAEAGTSILNVQVQEAETFDLALTLDNSRSPSVGSLRRQIQMQERNLSGRGDQLDLGYANTDGSDSLDLAYTLPINARNGTLGLNATISRSRIIEQPFDAVDIRSPAQSVELTLRQPIYQTPTRDWGAGLTFSHSASDTTLLGIPFQLSPGADEAGRTRLSVLRAFVETLQRGSDQVLSARLTFSTGLDWLDATRNPEPPDGRFVSLRGQGVYLYQFAPDHLISTRVDVQVADRPLVGLEQFGLGGSDTVRGYRQNARLNNNGFFASVEWRYPLFQQDDQVLQLATFLDGGRVWGRGSGDTLVGTGLGLIWRQMNFDARLDIALPLVDSDAAAPRSWQDNGLYFSVRYALF